MRVTLEAWLSICFYCLFGDEHQYTVCVREIYSVEFMSKVCNLYVMMCIIGNQLYTKKEYVIISSCVDGEMKRNLIHTLADHGFLFQ